MTEFGIAAWLFNKKVLTDKTMTQLDIPAAVKAIGVDRVDLVSSFFPNQTASYLNELRAAAAKAGVSINGIAVDMGDISLADPARRRTDLEAIKQWFFTARALGATAIRVNSGGDEKSRPGEIDTIIASYRELVAEAERLEVKLLVENHGGASNSAVLLEEVFSAIQSPWFGTCPDSGNFIDGTWRDCMRVMAPRAAACHIKVTAYSDDGFQPRIGNDGRDRSCNLKVFLQQLKDADYVGPYSVELGLPEIADETEAARAALDYVKQLISNLD